MSKTVQKVILITSDFRLYSDCQVQILEASERVGGRVYTHVDEEQGWYGELGAMRFPSSDILLNLFIDKFNLPMNTFQEYNPNTYYYVNNVLAKTKDVERNISLLKFNLTAGELALNSPDKIFGKAIKPILDDAAQHGWAYTVDKYGHFNIKTYLDQSGISPGAIRMIGVMLDEEGLFSNSMLESIRDALTINNLTVFREFVGGAHKLLDPFLEDLNDDILLHSKVVAIKQDNGAVQDEYPDNTFPGRSRRRVRPVRPTYKESVKPIRPTYKESVRPVGPTYKGSMRPVRPTYKESVRPVRPTYKESMRPVGPTYKGSMRPVRPTHKESVRPVRPTYKESVRPVRPTHKGSVRPTYKESVRPVRPTYKESVNYDRNRLPERPLPETRPIRETVKQSNGKVHVTYVDNTSPDNPSIDTKTVTGDYCIMTATAKASLLINYDPPLTQNKRSALYDLHYEHSTKIFLYFSKAFWIEEGIVGGQSITDGFSRFIYYPSHNFTTGGAILASYTWGDDAIFWLSVDDEQCKQMALDTLSRIHKRDLSSLYVSGVVKKWTEDQYSHGAFAIFTPTQERDLFEYLYQRQGNILFAGEHTTLKHAWVEGAMISALRSVVQITHDSYDIAIVGGGPIGLAAALFCAKQGKSVVVLEKFTFKNKNGSSNGASRQFRELYAEKLLAEFATGAVKLWKDLEEWSGKKLLYQDGYLLFGNASTGKTTEGDFNSIKKVCEELQLDCESINNSELNSEFHFSNTPKEWIGLFQQTSGQIDVQQTLAALIQLAEENDVDLVDNVDIDGIQFENGTINLKFKDNSVQAKKTILAPGPYANELFDHLGFQINLTIWELPSFYYKMKTDVVYPTWFAFGDDTQNLFYGFPENSWERPGHTRVSPDFVKASITNPSQRTNIPDHDSFVNTTKFVRKYMPDVDPDDYIIENTTCLATMVPDGGFVLDFAPKRFVQNNTDVVIFAAGWGFKFVPLYGKILADLAINGTTTYNITSFSINRPGVLLKETVV